MTQTAVDTLRTRGEPARYERLLGEILVGLDRAGQLRRLASATLAADPAAGDASADPATADDDRDRAGARRPAPAASDPVRARHRRPTRSSACSPSIRDELAGPNQRRLAEIEPGRWWLADREDLEGAATPLADRVEWAVFSLLSTAGPISEASFFDRMAAMFSGADLPDESLVRACLDSYRSLASTPDRLITGDDLLRRSQEHTELLARSPRPAIGSGCASGSGAASRPVDTATGLLGDLLEPGEQRAYLGGLSHAADELAEVDAIWYVRGKVGLPVRGRVDGHAR